MSDWPNYEPPAMADALQRALERGLPGRSAQRCMAHALAYGRHHGPVPDDARRAAVLVALHRTIDGWSVPAVLRPPTMRSHAGQIGLPGGLIEADETVVHTALREFEEELGSPGSVLRVLGQLSPVFVFVSNFEVTPVLAVADQPHAFRPNPHEVAEVIEISVAKLLEPTCRGRHPIERRGLRFHAPHFEIGGRQIWGATSLILAEFAALLERL